MAIIQYTVYYRLMLAGGDEMERTTLRGQSNGGDMHRHGIHGVRGVLGDIATNLIGIRGGSCRALSDEVRNAKETQRTRGARVLQCRL